MRCGYRHVLLGRAKELLRIEQKAAMERAGGKAHYTGVDNNNN